MNNVVEVGVTRNYVELKEAMAAGKRFSLHEGSSGSAKTYGIIQCGIETLLREKATWTTFRADQATCRDSVIADFKNIMINHFGIWKDAQWNASNMEYHFPNGSIYQFRGASSPAKLHGPRRHYAHLNEVMEISYDAYVQIAARTAVMLILDWNPSLNHHWVFDKVMTRDDVAYTHSTFKDNPFLPTPARNEILKYEPTPENIRLGTADEWSWSVYGLGKRGRKQGAIFKMWDVVDEFPDRWNCQRWGYGLDYGFSQDPTALVECALFQDVLYLREHLYEKELVAQRNELDPSIGSIEGRLASIGIPQDARVHDDNARPEITQALRNAGFKMISAKKGPGSVIAGIDRLRTYPIRVHRSSHNLQMELEAYSWAKSAQGVWLDVPEDKNNHLIDAARYWAMAELQPLRKPRATARRRARGNQQGKGFREWR
jgi:phage terminase large subunit